MVTAYKFEVVVLDFEGVGIDEVKGLIEENKYLCVNVIDSKAKDIPEWDDDHILNQGDTPKYQIDAFFQS